MLTDNDVKAFEWSWASLRENQFGVSIPSHKAVILHKLIV